MKPTISSRLAIFKFATPIILCLLVIALIGALLREKRSPPHPSEAAVVEKVLLSHVEASEEDADLSIDYQHATTSKVLWSRVVLRHLRIPVDETWGSHNIVLVAALYATRGPILELGGGFYSTPLIHNIAAEQGRYVLTAESQSAWLDKFLVLTDKKHEFAFVKLPVYAITPFSRHVPKPTFTFDRWEDVGIDRRWGLTFVDRSPGGQRPDDVLRLKNVTNVFVVHDTDDDWFAAKRLAPVKRLFPYVFQLARAHAKGRACHTDAWSVHDETAIMKIKKLACWTEEIIAKKPIPLDKTDCP